MSARPWYAWYPADYRAKTQHLNFIEDCAYRRMLDAYYNRGGPIDSDRGGLYRICGAMTEDEQGAIDKCASEFFYLNDNMLHHKRCDEELQKQASIRDRLSAAGKRGAAIAGRGRPKDDDRPMDRHSHNHNHNHNHNPQLQPQNSTTRAQTTGAKAPFVLPVGIDAELWADFIEMRKKQRKPPTERAMWLIAGKLFNLQAAGNDIRKVLQQSIRNGWQDVFELRAEKSK